ncbi:monothiol glutaredoxin-S1, mitochondrial-like [Phragmites australis]|uniref:monothiol glutaredoxin-S1, mitochondrial-like n=1 Tax=Phragmites australis TaxID=29695 RepID=UPI002D778AF6|nr:monothiol glutaredoxin-S1, mitochondrial-like [Phragmites australis]
MFVVESEIAGHHEEVGVDRAREESSQIVSRAEHSSFQQFMNYSSGHGGDPNANGDSTATRIPADPDTHQDFETKSKSLDMSLHDIVAQDIKEKPVLIYMKGFRESPMCGFSALAVKVLEQYDVPISSRDILGDLKLKECVKAHTNWPTFPQIFIKGEFIGGSDIILNMHQKGVLKDLLADMYKKVDKAETHES